MTDRLNELHRERSDLKLQGRVREAIPVQLAILAESEKSGRVRDVANAWNYLSALHHQVCEYDKAEHAARKAIDVYTAEPAPSAEVLGAISSSWLRFLQHNGAMLKPFQWPRLASAATVCSTIRLTSS